MSWPMQGYAERDLDEPKCARCETPESWCRCLPIVLCPSCGAEHEDVTGFGVLFCEECNFCQHANAVNGICFQCRKKVSDAA